MLTLTTFGVLGVSTDGTDAPVATQPRRLALLAVIAAYGRRGMPRDKAVTLFWPDADLDRGRNSLSQALYALRRDLGAEGLFLDSAELAIDPAVLRCDVLEFQAAIAARDHARAVELYGGPFLEGFQQKDTPELNRWVDDRRGELAIAFAGALEQLARDASARRDLEGAVRWWRRLVAHDPLSAPWTVGLMEALAAAGDRAAALRAARAHTELVREEFGAEADAGVRRLEEQYRRGGPGAPLSAPVPVVPSPAPEAGPPAAPPRAAWRPLVEWGVVAALVLLLGWGGYRWSHRAPAVLAVGEIRDLTADSVAGSAAQSLVGGFIANGLGQVPEIRLISAERMAELMHTRDLGVLAAARAAGATELVEGTLLSAPGGVLRLDLRRIEIGSGRVRQAETVTGTTLIGVADSAVRRILAGFDVRRSAPDRGTTSVLAERQYQAGLRAYFSGSYDEASRLFSSALESDPGYAMAAYFAARATGRQDLMAHADSLATAAPERDRLRIRAMHLSWSNAVGMVAVADSLTRRYPDEPSGWADLASALESEAGDYLGAVEAARRALLVDRGGLATQRGTLCVSCQAIAILVRSAMEADSLDLALREAQRWRAEAADKVVPTYFLAQVLMAMGRTREALAADSLRHQVDPAFPADRLLPYRLMFVGEYEAARQAARRLSASPDPALSTEGVLRLSQIEMETGRPDSTLARLRRYDAAQVASGRPASTPQWKVYAEIAAGRPAEAVAIARGYAGPVPTATGELGATNTVILGTLTATALAAAGDTAPLAALADTVRRAGARNLPLTNRTSYHYILGLLALARREDQAAINELGQALAWDRFRNPRVPYLLAGAYLRTHRPVEAAALLGRALRTYDDRYIGGVTRTELRALLGRAFLERGQRDSARVYLQSAERAWRDAEPVYAARRDSLRVLLAGL